MTGKLGVMRDPIADALDDMAALGEYWKRNRDKGRMPSAIRQAMLLTAREVLMLVDMEQQETARRMSELCGPDAYARNNSDKGETPNAELRGDGPASPARRPA